MVFISIFMSFTRALLNISCLFAIIITVYEIVEKEYDELDEKNVI